MPTLRISLALNGILLGLTAYLAFVRGPAEHDRAGSEPVVATAPNCGGPDATAKQLLALQLLDESPVTRDEYWQPRIVRDFQRQSAQAAAAERARQKALQIVDTAADDPAFRALFRPLDAQFPFLSSTQQIELQRLRLRADQRRAELIKNGDAATGQLAIRDEFLASLQRLLNATELFEYQLRDSPTAQLLLASGFQFSEDEFRRVFRAIVDSAGAQAALEGTVMLTAPAVMGKIEHELGAARFAQYRQGRDPQHRLLRTIAPTTIRPLNHRGNAP